MKTQTSRIALLSLSVMAATLWSQDQGAGGKQALQQRLAELKQQMAANRAALKKYQWVETTQVSIKGETKKVEQKACHYGPDGQVAKAAIGTPEAPKEPPGGLRGRVVKKKVAEMKDYMSRLQALIGHYVPPEAERLQTSFQAGKANLNRSSSGLASLSFGDYYKPGDKIALGFDTTAKTLRSFDVNSYLDGPEDTVTLASQFSSLPDGTNFVQRTVLTSKSKETTITTTNSDYTPASQ